MEAVVDCYFRKGPPPPELRLAWQCKRWETLPEDGNLLGQPARLMNLMSSSLSIYNALQNIHELKNKVHLLSESDRLILRVLMDAGLIFKA